MLATRLWLARILSMKDVILLLVQDQVPLLGSSNFRNLQQDLFADIPESQTNDNCFHPTGLTLCSIRIHPNLKQILYLTWNQMWAFRWNCYFYNFHPESLFLSKLWYKVRSNSLQKSFTITCAHVSFSRAVHICTSLWRKVKNRVKLLERPLYIIIHNS